GPEGGQGRRAVHTAGALQGYAAGSRSCRAQAHEVPRVRGGVGIHLAGSDGAVDVRTLAGGDVGALTDCTDEPMQPIDVVDEAGLAAVRDLALCRLYHAHIAHVER